MIREIHIYAMGLLGHLLPLAMSTFMSLILMQFMTFSFVGLTSCVQVICTASGSASPNPDIVLIEHRTA